MDIYLPIAEVSVNVLVIVGLGALVGMLAGMFGVGGGFLTTPLLIFYGIPPAVAVASAANQIAGASVSGAIAHFRRGGVDVRMGAVLIAGGLAGSLLGAWLFRLLKTVGQLDLVINLAYVILLGSVGALMLTESVRAILRARRGEPPPRRKRHEGLAYRLPWKMRFRKSGLYISVLAPLSLGLGIGVLTAILGVGGGFLMLPAMIYILGMPASVVVGTSLFQIIFTTGAVTVLHAWTSQTVDAVLALMLLLGGVTGANLGARVAQRLKAEQLRALLAVLVLGIAIRLFIGLTWRPEDLFLVELLTP